MSARAADALAEIHPGWRALVMADPSSSPSHRPALWEAFAAALPGFEWRLLVHESHGELVGGAPVVITRRGPLCWLFALPWGLPAPPLARPGEHARVDAAVSDAFATLARERQVLGGEWSWYRPEGPEPDPAALARVPGTTRRVDAALLRLAGGPGPLRAAMHRKQRQALDHARTHGLVFAEEPRALDEAYALHLAQSRHWPGHRALPLELSRRLLQAAPADGPVARLFTLRSAHELVSASLALDGPHETFAWWSGTHPSGRRLQASALLLGSMAEWASARGRLRFNLGASTGLGAVAAFKRSLGGEAFTYPVRVLDARHASWPGRALAGVLARPRPGRVV